MSKISPSGKILPAARQPTEHNYSLRNFQLIQKGHSHLRVESWALIWAEKSKNVCACVRVWKRGGGDCVDAPTASKSWS